MLPHFRILASRLSTRNLNRHGFNAELSLTGVGCGLQTRRGREAQRFNSSWSAITHLFSTLAHDRAKHVALHYSAWFLGRYPCTYILGTVRQASCLTPERYFTLSQSCCEKCASLKYPLVADKVTSQNQVRSKADPAEVLCILERVQMLSFFEL